ncbi:hypothetical protein MVEN_01031500 [Mycena venus]|uniref:ARM repeat-containing protein n=1 Tax=Mycena venus TaxID=2733690 RepID=A0A8H6Y9N4_9AGAR|nr:hypothetical protein MVEN_01031500 [Mycena venus]
MQPLTRQETHISIRSWWSDRNPGLQGPTINIHAMAKPILRRMYHRQALEFVENNRGSPLLSTTLDIYFSYLPLNYVWRSTKVEILWDLVDRAVSEDDARVIVDPPVFNYIAGMLGSQDAENLSQLYRLLFEKLASHESTLPAIWESQACAWLVLLLHDEDTEVISWALRTLTEFSHWSEGAQAIVDSGVRDHVVVLLESPNSDLRKWTCQLVARLEKHELTASAIWEEQKLCERLVSLMHDESPEVTEWATDALVHIAQWIDGAQAIVDAYTLAPVLALLQSQRPNVPEWTCYLVGTLAGHKSIAPNVFELNTLMWLVFLLRDRNFGVVAGATYALSQIAQWSDGAEAIVAAKVLDHVSALLESSNTNVRIWTCEIVKKLATHESTAPAVLRLKLWAGLVSLSREPKVATSAMAALVTIRKWPNREVETLDHIISGFIRPEEERGREQESLKLGDQDLPHLILRANVDRSSNQERALFNDNSDVFRVPYCLRTTSVVVI